MATPWALGEVLSKEKTMSALITPMLGDIYWIGGSTLGLILLIILIVALVRR